MPVLKDENEQARRAAVEVLNEVGDARSVKYLLEAIKDDDWWVRSRAGDALGKIGGPKVIDAVLELVRDKDEDIRRAAIEILNQTKDERAINHLIEATKDADWWVSERAVDALAEIGSKRARAAAVGDAAHRQCARAAGGGARDRQARRCRSRSSCSRRCCNRNEKEIRIEAIQALARLADEPHAEQIRAQLQGQTANSDATVARAAVRAMTELEVRFSSGVTAPTAASPGGQHAPGPAGAGGRAGPHTADPGTRGGRRSYSRSRPRARRKLDIDTLTPGRHDRGALQVHRTHRPRRLRHRAADGRHRGR